MGGKGGVRGTWMPKNICLPDKSLTVTFLRPGRTWRRSAEPSGLKVLYQVACVSSWNFGLKKEYRELPINWKHCFFAVNCRNSVCFQGTARGHSTAQRYWKILSYPSLWLRRGHILTSAPNRHDHVKSGDNAEGRSRHPSF